MPTRSHALVKTAPAIAAAFLMSGCATLQPAPGEQEYPLDRVGSAIGETGSRIWEGTRNLLRFLGPREESDDLYAYPSEDEYLDDVDVALMEPQPGSDMDSDADGNLYSDEDVIYTVGDNENLWTLAKMLTGDANNWRVLAEVNELDANGTVYAGQKLLIPADLKRIPVDPSVQMQAEPGQTDVVAAATQAAPRSPRMQKVERLKLPTEADLEVTDMSAATDAEAPSDAEPAVSEPAVLLAEVDMDEDKRGFKLLANETLWDLTKRTTGDATNWKKIAVFNGMDEKSATRVRFGQTINIPQSMVRTDKPIIETDEPAIAAASAAETPAAQLQGETEKAVAVVAETIKPAVKSAAAESTTVASMQTTEEAAAELVEVEAKFQGEPLELPDTTVAAAAPQPAPKTMETTDRSRQIMVSGTYYPKAIYNDANFSSSLLMRVSPGTSLTVTRAIGPWFEVQTEKGPGFVHSRDTR